MDLGGLQAELRHFAAEREWQPLQTPKNLTTALMVEAAELAEIFQWMTPEASIAAYEDAKTKSRIGAEVADVLIYLLQVADHCQVDLPSAVQSKLIRNAAKYPASLVIPRAPPSGVSVQRTHVLLDYENVQPSEEQLRQLVPDVRQLWVFHGPHQRQVGQRFISFGDDVTAVPISKTGKNALDFHLTFYIGYIASRSPAAKMVVVANDKGYEPMIEHARAMGFAVQRLAFGAHKLAAKKSAAKKAAPKKTAAKKAAVEPVAAKHPPAPKPAAKRTAAAPAAKKVAAKKNGRAKKLAKQAAVPVTAASLADTAGAGSRIANGSHALVPDSAATIKKLTDSLRKMGDKRPTKPASLWRSVKALLGTNAAEEAVESALAKLIADGVVRVDSIQGASYPRFDSAGA